MDGRLPPAALAELLADPHYFPHAIDLVGRSVSFVPTDAQRLARPSFIDGRTDFAAGSAINVTIDAVLAEAPPPSREPDRMIFHVSFCGSTLLARMLEMPGSAFALKEPNALVDIANAVKAGVADARPALDWLRGSLRRRWRPAEPVVVKPSNWVNNLLPALTTDPETIRPLFVTMERRPFLIAVLRGGRDRLAYTMRAASHLARSQEEQAWLQRAVADVDDPLARAARMTLASLHIQMTGFAAALAHGRWGAEHVMDAAAVTGRPVEAALAANRVLDLGIDPDRLATHAAAASGENSKNPGRAFTPADRAGEDEAMEAHHGALIDGAMIWAEAVLGPHPRLS